VVGVKQSVSEQAILFGERQSLVGIITQPATRSAAEDLAFVILNTGIVHRVGDHRMFVTMSRLLARAGHTVLRFDFSGIGDSDPRIDKRSPLESSMADIREALNWLKENRQLSRIVLVGLCSGADHAVLYGHTDPRVVGLVLMDPTIPATTRYYLHHITRQRKQLRNWINLVTGRSQLIKIVMEQTYRFAQRKRPSPEITLQNLRFHPSLAEIYGNSVNIGIRILAIFTQEPMRQTYRDQIFDAFPNIQFRDQLSVEFFGDSDHTFSKGKDRDRLMELILKWVRSSTLLKPFGTAR
jgi:pimeloyl-ACP methyl ester carboxylesterase